MTRRCAHELLVQFGCTTHSILIKVLHFTVNASSSTFLSQNTHSTTPPLNPHSGGRWYCICYGRSSLNRWTVLVGSNTFYIYNILHLNPTNIHHNQDNFLTDLDHNGDASVAATKPTALRGGLQSFGHNVGGGAVVTSITVRIYITIYKTQILCPKMSRFGSESINSTTKNPSMFFIWKLQFGVKLFFNLQDYQNKLSGCIDIISDKVLSWYDMIHIVTWDFVCITQPYSIAFGSLSVPPDVPQGRHNILL